MTWRPWDKCHICKNRVDHDWDPCYVETDPGHYLEDGPYEVAMGNGLYVNACWSCYMRWPGEHKRPPWLTVAEREAFAALSAASLQPDRKEIAR